MTREAFDTLVNRLEVASSDRPDDLMLRAVGLIVLGYLILGLAILFGLSLAGAGVWLMLSSPWTPQAWLAILFVPAGLGVAFLILSCLWVPLEEPKGVRLDPGELPELFRFISDIGPKTRKIHRVILDGELNASVVQLPRFGLCGWHRTWLVIGMPLMQALPPDEFRAVLAHEFAHLDGCHSGISRWLHRTRMTWERVLDRLEDSSWCPLLGRLLAWFWPRFNAPAFILSRMQEFECDRVAAHREGVRPLADGLMRLAIQSQRLEENFWQPLHAGIRHHESPPGDIMRQMSAFLRKPMDPESAARRLSQALRMETDNRDSHPGLSERLEKLGILEEESRTNFEHPPAVPAVDLLLPASFREQAESALSRLWQDGATKRWREKHREALDLKKTSRSKSPGIRESWERIAALSRLDGLGRMQPEILALLDRKPDHAGALYLRGCHLAQREDPQAISFLERAANDPTIAVQAFDTLADFHRRCGRVEEILQLKRRANRHEQELRAALVERNKLDRHDSFASHELDPTCVESLREVLKDHPAVKRAWLVAKHVRHFPHWRHFVLILDTRWSALRSISDTTQQQLLSRILKEWEVDGYVLAVRDDGEHRPVARTIRRLVPDCEVYRQS